MSYRTTIRRIRGTEPLDPLLFNDNVQPAAREISGRLNEHNVKAGPFPASRIPSHCYYQFSTVDGATPYYVSVAADHGIRGGGPYYPTAGINAWRVPDTAEWETVGGSGATALTRTFTTGESILWLIALVQYALVDTSFSVTGGNPKQKPRLQFALRVDGAVIESTITGQTDYENPAPRTYLPNKPASVAGSAPYSIHTFETPGTAGMMYHCRPVRLQEHVPVQEGSHTVDVVVRRLPDDIIANDTGAFATTNAPPVYCFNRKFLCVDLHLQPKAASGDDSVEITSLVEGDSASVANLYTNSIQTLVNKVNALNEGTIIRNGLRHEHLPSRVFNPFQLGHDTGQAAFSTAYPGFGATVGWTQITNAGGVALQYDAAAITGGVINFTTTPAFVIVLANIHLFAIETAYPGAAGGVTAGSYAFFTPLVTYQSGAVVGDNLSEVFINNPNVVVDTAVGPSRVSFGCQTDVPLFDFYDYRTSPPGPGSWAFYGYYGASKMDTNANPPLDQRQSNMMILMFRP